MKTAVAAYRRLPARNKKIVRVYFFLVTVGIIAALLVFLPDDTPQNESDIKVKAKAHARGATAPSLPRGQVKVDEAYLRTKNEAERIRKAEARKKKESYVPSVREYVAERDIDPAAERLLAGGTAGEQEEDVLSPASPDDVAGNANKMRCDPGHTGQKGLRLSDGRCVMPNGDVYDKNGKLVISRGGPGGDGDYAGSRYLATEETEKIRKQRINRFIAVMSEIDKEEQDRANVKLPKTKKEKKKKKGRSGEPAPSTRSNKKDASRDDRNTAFTGFRPGDMLIGLLDTQINSDVTKEVRVIIPTGALKGAKMIGEIGKIDRSGYVAAKLRFITFKDHHAKISAVLVDPATKNTALAGDIDRHLLSRLGAAFIYGISVGAKELITRQGNTTITSGSTTVARPAPSNSEILKVGAGKTAEILTDPLKELINRKPTITIPQHSIVGILFLEPTKIEWLPKSAMREAAKP